MKAWVWNKIEGNKYINYMLNYGNPIRKKKKNAYNLNKERF